MSRSEGGKKEKISGRGERKQNLFHLKDDEALQRGK